MTMLMRRVLDLPGWGARNAYDEVHRMQQQVSRLVDALQTRSGVRGAGVFPALNIAEDKEAYRIRAELPGLKSDDLDIEVVDRNLTISGQRRIACEESACYHRREREAGRFSRVVELPGEIDTGRVTANLVNGILTITAPKSEAAKPKRIQIG